MAASVVAAVLALAALSPALAYVGDQLCCSCDDLMPSSRAAGSGPQIMPSPFKISVDSASYKPNEGVLVTIGDPTGQAEFIDFMLVAHSIDNRPKDPMGAFSLVSGSTDASPKQTCLEGTSYAIVGTDTDPKKTLQFIWKADGLLGHVEFRATFVVSTSVYWVAEKSAILLDASRDPPALPHGRPKTTPPINTDECGKTKGCYREPEGCWEPNCEFIATWRELTDSNVRFEIGGLTDNANNRFVAMSMSNDTYVGEDVVFACAHDASTQYTRVLLAYNTMEGDENIPLPTENVRSAERPIMDVEGSHYNGRLRCRFTAFYDLGLIYPETNFYSGNPYHIIMSRGFQRKGVIPWHDIGVNELPVASPEKVSLRAFEDVGGRARYPLVKAHGCLMILAWIFFSSIGMLFSKYYKSMWPNSRMFDQRYWLVVHFNCMAMAFLITLIGVILIFIEADGWTKAPDLPYRAHPILGTIIFICIIIIPIMALLRPPEDSKCLCLHQWFYWIFCTVANVLAIPQIFIGMDFGKANIPWWATWILVIWVICHIIIELSLEIHQCCTYKKNKERRKKWELQKHDNPKLHIDEPEPAGRRFKRFMLYLHLTLTTITTLIMIIIIAVC